MIGNVAVLLAALSSVASATATFSYAESTGCVISSNGGVYNYCGQNEWDSLDASCGSSNTAASPVDIDFPSVMYDYSDLQGPVFSAIDGGCKDYDLGFDETLYLDIQCNNFTMNHRLHGSLENDVVTYTLDRVNFHSPSQHTLGGGHFAAEAEFLYESEQGHNVVLSVFLDQADSSVVGNDNVFFELLRSDYVDGVESKINPLDITPGNNAMYYYEGSLSQPPCTEEVDRFLFVQPVSISATDLAFIRGVLSQSYPSAEAGTTDADGGNSRSTQPLYNRTVYYFRNEVLTTPSPSSYPTPNPTASPTTYQQRPIVRTKPQLATTDSQKVNLGVILGSVALGTSGCVLLALMWMSWRYLLRSPDDIRAEARRLKGLSLINDSN